LGPALRFTQKGDALYAILLDTPKPGRVVIPGLRAASPQTHIRLLGWDGDLSWRQEGGGGGDRLARRSAPCPRSYPAHHAAGSADRGVIPRPGSGVS